MTISLYSTKESWLKGDYSHRRLYYTMISTTNSKMCFFCHASPLCVWVPTPGEPLYHLLEGTSEGICDWCRELEERRWLVKATSEQLLLAINYTWAEQRKTFPRYCMSVQEMYQRRLAGEDFRHTSWDVLNGRLKPNLS